MAFMDDLKAKANDLLGDAKEAFDQAQDKVGDWADKAKDTAGDLVDKAKDTAGDLVDKAKDLTDGDNTPEAAQQAQQSVAQAAQTLTQPPTE